MIDPNFVFLGIALTTLGNLSYVIDTVKGRVKPNRVSFFLWALAPLLAFSAQVNQGVGKESLLTLSVGLFPIVILLATFFNKKSEWKITKFDLVCGFLSLVGLVLWLITKEGNIAIVFSLIADGLAAIPTVVKAYKYPETETIWPWITVGISGLISLLIITTWNFANYAFPLYIFLANIVIFAEIQFKIGKRYSIH